MCQYCTPGLLHAMSSSAGAIPFRRWWYRNEMEWKQSAATCCDLYKTRCSVCECGGGTRQICLWIHISTHKSVNKMQNPTIKPQNTYDRVINHHFIATHGTMRRRRPASDRPIDNWPCQSSTALPLSPPPPLSDFLLGTLLYSILSPAQESQSRVVL